MKILGIALIAVALGVLLFALFRKYREHKANQRRADLEFANALGPWLLPANPHTPGRWAAPQSVSNSKVSGGITQVSGTGYKTAPYVPTPYVDTSVPAYSYTDSSSYSSCDSGSSASCF
jgi:hypothetical protein